MKGLIFITALILAFNTMADTYVFKGAIDKYPITMNIDLDYVKQKGEYTLKGEYSYDKYKKPINITGHTTSDQYGPKEYLIIKENGAEFKLTKTEQEKLPAFSGTWTSDIGKTYKVEIKATKRTNTLEEDGFQFKFVQEPIYNHQYNDLDQYIEFDGHKVSAAKEAFIHVENPSVKKLEVGDQQVYQLTWRLSASASGYGESVHYVYYHAKSESILEDPSRSQVFSVSEYKVIDCNTKKTDSNIVRVCMYRNTVNQNTENYEKEIYSVNDAGFQLIGKELASSEDFY